MIMQTDPKQGIVGYKQQQQCTTEYQSTITNVVKNYTIRYDWNGVVGKSYTYNKYNVGDRIPVTITINAN